MGVFHREGVVKITKYCHHIKEAFFVIKNKPFSGSTEKDDFIGKKVRKDQFRYIKIQPQTQDLRTRLWGINPTNSVFIPQSLVLRSIV